MFNARKSHLGHIINEDFETKTADITPIFRFTQEQSSEVLLIDLIQEQSVLIVSNLLDQIFGRDVTILGCEYELRGLLRKKKIFPEHIVAFVKS